MLRLIELPVRITLKNMVDMIDVKNFIAPVVVVEASTEVGANPDWLLTVDFLEAWEARYGRIPAGGWVFVSLGLVETDRSCGFPEFAG